MSTKPMQRARLFSIMAVLIQSASACSPSAVVKPERTMYLGLRTAIYHVADLSAAKAWYANVLGVAPYFDEPFDVGFNVGGYELGRDPDTSEVATGAAGSSVYWGTANADSALAQLLGAGAKPHS